MGQRVQDADFGRAQTLPDIDETRFRLDGSPLPSDEYLSEFLEEREINEMNELRRDVRLPVRP